MGTVVPMPGVADCSQIPFLPEFLYADGDAVRQARRRRALGSFPVLAIDWEAVADRLDFGQPAADALRELSGARPSTVEVLRRPDLAIAALEHGSWDGGLPGLIEWLDRVPTEWLPRGVDGWRTFFRAQYLIYWLMRVTTIDESDLLLGSCGRWADLCRAERPFEEVEAPLLACYRRVVLPEVAHQAASLGINADKEFRSRIAARSYRLRRRIAQAIYGRLGPSEIFVKAAAYAHVVGPMAGAGRHHAAVRARSSPELNDEIGYDYRNHDLRSAVFAREVRPFLMMPPWEGGLGQWLDDSWLRAEVRDLVQAASTGGREIGPS